MLSYQCGLGSFSFEFQVYWTVFCGHVGFWCCCVMVVAPKVSTCFERECLQSRLFFVFGGTAQDQVSQTQTRHPVGKEPKIKGSSWSRRRKDVYQQKLKQIRRLPAGQKGLEFLPPQILLPERNSQALQLTNLKLAGAHGFIIITFSHSLISSFIHINYFAFCLDVWNSLVDRHSYPRTNIIQSFTGCLFWATELPRI